mmetsp:Transcript_60857/g.145057  ORF Transcript_60857/g.145057 Transcript_60857/m.145057 type:complete len:641 (-) Transcript_60857:221-2143(-)
MYGANLKTIPAGVDGPAVLAQIRQRVEGPDGPPKSMLDSLPYLRSDHMLVRFIIARQWDVEKAWTMLSEHYRWMVEKRVEALVTDPFPEAPHIKKYYPQAYHGTDKLGRPIYIERPGKIDMPRILQTITPERLLEYVFAGSELQVRRRLPGCSLARGEIIDKSLNILDLSGMGLGIVSHNTARKVVKEAVTTIQNHYPEMMGKMVIINAPKVFSIAWTFVKPMLDEKTVSKISIFSSDKEAYSKALLELVDADQLPALFGGTCKCDGKDPESCMLQEKGPWMDKEIMEILDAEPLERLMTPEGARLLQERRGVVVSSTPTKSPPPSASPSPSPAKAADADAEEDDEARDSVPANLPNPAPAPPAETMTEAESEVAALIQEYQREEEKHMQTLAAWVTEFNDLSRELGRPRIERAQGYYDTMAIWQQVVQEYSRQQQMVEQISSELENAVAVLSKAENAVIAFLTGEGEQLTDEQWDELIPLQVDDPLILAEPKLLRTFKVSQWADKVTRLQWQRDAAQAELKAKGREVEEAKRRYEAEEQSHSRCTWNCSVKRTAIFYEKRRLHEKTVDSQIANLQSIETNIYAARCKIVQERGGKSAVKSKAGSVRGRGVSVDAMSLQSFELAGAEPLEEEFMSCGSSE